MSDNDSRELGFRSKLEASSPYPCAENGAESERRLAVDRDVRGAARQAFLRRDKPAADLYLRKIHIQRVNLARAGVAHKDRGIVGC